MCANFVIGLFLLCVPFKVLQRIIFFRWEGRGARQTRKHSRLAQLHLWLFHRNITRLEMWANDQRDGHPAEHRWRPPFNAAKFRWR